jgi:hypothetical protein
VNFSTEIIVVDNASSDGTCELVRDQFPTVHLLQTGENLGFAKANNAGIRASRGEYICLINSDVNVPSNCLQQVTDYISNHPDIGMLGPQMLGPDGNVERSSMRFPTLWNCFCRALALDSLLPKSKVFGGQLMRDFNHNQVADVEVLNGWFWVVRREALDQVGLLDERFFIYGEDIDWSKRFHMRGWRVVFYPGASALHYGGASSSNAPVRFFIEQRKASLQYWEKHHSPTARIAHLLLLGMEHALRVVGHGAMWLLRPANRGQQAFKVARSAALLTWLAKGKWTNESRAAARPETHLIAETKNCA